jgi:acetoin utilization deacetylase AcuC-like enzyme
MCRMVAHSARKHGGGCFAILEGGYSHDVIGQNAAALTNGRFWVEVGL